MADEEAAMRERRATLTLTLTLTLIGGSEREEDKSNERNSQVGGPGP